MKEQADYLVAEIGKLKGSIVKIGQMMALYGEHFLPEEVTQALNTLNNKTVALAWPAIKAQLQQQLGSKLDDLTVDHEPLGTASWLRCIVRYASQMVWSWCLKSSIRV